MTEEPNAVNATAYVPTGAKSSDDDDDDDDMAYSDCFLQEAIG